MNENDEVLEYDLDFQVKKVKLKNKETGLVEEYTITELKGTDRDKHLSNMGARVRFADGQPAGMNFDGHQAYLITLAMRDKDGKPVTIEQVQSWPSRVQEDLYSRIQKMSKIDPATAKKEEENAKKS